MGRILESLRQTGIFLLPLAIMAVYGVGALGAVTTVTGTQYKAEGLAKGTHYFAVTAIGGAESAQSNVGSKTIQ